LSEQLPWVEAQQSWALMCVSKNNAVQAVTSFLNPIHSLVEERGRCVCPQVVHGVQASSAVAVKEELEGVDDEHDHKEGDRNGQGHQVEENRSELGAKRVSCRRNGFEVFVLLPFFFLFSDFA
jgi:hypothetical protein